MFIFLFNEGKGDVWIVFNIVFIYWIFVLINYKFNFKNIEIFFNLFKFFFYWF